MAEGVLSIPDLTAKATENYSRFIAQSQEFLAKIYRGEVAPSGLQEQFRAFMQERGAPYSLELSQLSARFSSALLGLSARYSDEFFHGLLPDSPDFQNHNADIPTQHQHDWNRLNQTLTSVAAEQYGNALARYQHLLQKVAKGEISSAAMQDYARQFGERRSSEYARDIAALNTEFLEGLMRLSQRVIDDLFTYLADRNAVAKPQRPVETLAMELTGGSGSTVSSSLTVDNELAESALVQCAVSEFRSADGTGQGFRAAIELEPVKFWLRPDETATIRVRLTLDPNLFHVDKSYVATLLIQGPAEQDILVFLTARALAS
jgi:hypothetical protein